MRLLRIGPPGGERPAVLLPDGRVLDVSERVEDYGPEFFAAGGPATLARVVEEEGEDLPAIDPDAERIGPPIARPRKVIGIGLNYEDHAREAGMEIPTEPIVFMKASSAVCGPYDDLLLPPGAEQVDWEVELGLVVGATARRLPDLDHARATVAGFLVANDVSERFDQLERGGQWVKGKSAETFCPIGPWLVTPEEIDDPTDLDLELRVNGEPMQEGSTRTMIFHPYELVRYLSRFMVLEPGDLVLTGTPPGVGMARGRFLREGDVVEASITGLGRQRQVCVRVGG